ncbi:MAG: ZIP family metal transporter [Lachnospiraceae bacterium]
MNVILYAVGGTGFLFLMTTLGAAMVFLMKPLHKGKLAKTVLGFSAGVMLSTSVFALLIPAMEGMAGVKGIVYVVAGFSLGCVVLIATDAITGIKREKKKNSAGLLMLAMTLHNIPEGITVGLACATCADNPQEVGLLYAAMVLAFGIGIQNFPESTALAVTFVNDGYSRKKAFWYSVLSGAVEPAFGILAVYLSAYIKPVMPFLLAYAAGTMLHVTVEELIPDVQADKRLHLGTVGIMSGILLMLVLDMFQGL